MAISDHKKRVIAIMKDRGELPRDWSEDRCVRYLDRKAAEAIERLKQINK